MKKLLLSLLALCLISAPAHAQSSKATLNTEVSTNFPDNTTGAITPAILRTTVNDMIASWQQAPQVNAQTGTSYAFVVGDYGKLVTFSNAAPVAVTLPQATTTFATWNAFTCNKGAGAVTITPTTSTINGAATLVLQQTQCAAIISDGANYQISRISVQAKTCAASNWINAILSTFVPQCAQPAASDLSNGTTGSGAVVLAVSPMITGHPTIEGVTSTGATGTGAFVFSNTPTITNASHTGTTTFNGSINIPIRTITVAGAVTVSAASDYFICINKTVGAATTVNLPGSPATGLTFLVKDCKGDASTNNITLTPAAGNIDGAGTYVMSVNYQSVAVTYNGTQWFLN